MNFIQKHWKGEYPLWRSFWINFILIDIVFIISFSFIILSSLSEKETVIRLFFNYAVIAVFLAVWQTVGIWRSAEKRTTQTGKKLWSFVAELFTISCLIQTVMSLSSFFFSPEQVSATIRANIDEILKIKQEVIVQQETPVSKLQTETSLETEVISDTETTENTPIIH